MLVATRRALFAYTLTNLFPLIVEPNLLSHTTHSISRKGVKKRDLNDDELRDILSDVLPLVRIDHVIPHNSDSLHGAMRRGLISSPPSHMIEDEDLSPQEISASWIRSKNNPMFTAPRLFTPYFEDAKVTRRCISLYCLSFSHVSSPYF